MHTGRLLFTILLIFTYHSLTAQTGSVAGIVADPQTGERIPFANIAIYSGDESAPVTGDVSDRDGNFTIGRLPYGTYRLVISFIGYEPAEITGVEVSPATPGVILGTVNLSRSVTDLEEVEVTAMARTSSSRIDRTTYRAADFETARGGTASDLLGRLPSVSVSADGEVSVRGAFSYDTLNVDLNSWGSFSSLENDFELGRGIYAAYLNYSGNAGGLGFMAGLRMENTDQVMDIDNPDYFSLFDRETKSSYSLNKADLFPSLHLMYPVFEDDEITLAASRRINRPQTQNMAPFLYRRHHEVYEVGDPALEPEYLNNFELSWLKRAGNQNIRLTGFYRGTNNAILRIYTLLNSIKLLNQI